MKELKTNVMRLLEQKKVAYTPRYYPHEDNTAVDGLQVALLTGQDPARVFKTLVAVGASKTHYVFVVPVAKELNLKKAASAVKEKSIQLIAVRELLALTGYIRGGCSPVGMKKLFTTVFDASAAAQSNILVSGGKIGTQIECAPADLLKLCEGRMADLAE